MAKLFDLDAIQAIAADDLPAPHSLSPETRQLLLACFGLLHDTYNWHDYDEELTETQIDTIDLLVSKAMDEIIMVANLPSNTHLYWDGTRIRQALWAIQQPYTTPVIADSTTEVDIMSIAFSSTTFSTSNWLRFNVQLLITGTVPGDVYLFYLRYWDGTTYSAGGLYPWTVTTANMAIWQSYIFNVPQFIFLPPPASVGGNYLWKLSFSRAGGSGQATISRNVDSFMTVEEP